MNFAFPKSRKEGSIRSFLEKAPKVKIVPPKVQHQEAIVSTSEKAQDFKAIATLFLQVGCWSSITNR